jgi:adenylate kinase
VVRNRMTVYRTQTAPLVRFYEKAGLLSRINADRPIDLVSSELETLLQKNGHA